MSEPSPDTGNLITVEEEDEPHIRLRDMGVEDVIVLAVFWVLALNIFVQFFTRYALNSSLAWTEEIARYLLMTVGFVGSIMVVRKNTHIMVEFFYRYIPGLTARVLSVLIDLGRIAFFSMTAWICFKLAGRTHQMMVSIDFPKSWLYYMISVCLAAMAIRAVQVAIRHFRQGGSDMALAAVARRREVESGTQGP